MLKFVVEILIMINRYFLICLLSMSLGIIFYVYQSNILLLTQIVILGILFVLKRRNIFLMSVIVTLISLIITSQYLNLSESVLLNYIEEKCQGILKITEINYETSDYVCCDAEIININNNECNENAKLYIYTDDSVCINGIYDFTDMKLYISDKKDIISYGNRNFFSGTVSGKNLTFKSISNKNIIDKIKNFKTKTNEYINSIFSQDTGALICALYTGETRYISKYHKEIFSQTGISHILSVSGMHVIILMSVFGIFFDHLGKFKYLKYLILLLFVVFTGASPPIIRAACLYTFAGIGQIIKRSCDSINNLSLIALVSLLFNPLLLFDKSFQLSYLATYAVIAVSPLFYLKSDKKFFDFFSKAVSITLAAQIMTLPVTLTFASEISLVSLVANIAASLFTILIYPVSFISMILPFSVITAITEFTVESMYTLIKMLNKGDVFCFTFTNIQTAIIISTILSIMLFFVTIERKNRVIRKELKEVKLSKNKMDLKF